MTALFQISGFLSSPHFPRAQGGREQEALWEGMKRSSLPCLAGTAPHTVGSPSAHSPESPSPERPAWKSGEEAAAGLTQPVLSHSDHGWAGLRAVSHRELRVLF